MKDAITEKPKFYGGGTVQHSDDSGPSSEGPKISESQALFEVVKILEQVGGDELRARVLEGVAAFFRLSAPVQQSHPIRTPPNATGVATNRFSEDRTISPKEFVLQKQPRSEVERVACLAYYLTHYRETPHFKTFDISKLNTEAAQPKFTNASQAVDNATKTNYLAPATKGNKQLSGPGELFVQLMPDREGARAAMQSAMPRRRRRTTQPSSDMPEAAEENSGDE